MLKLLDITKEYKIEEESTLALHDVSIEFRKNEFVSILGPSGCGKTTLLNIIGGLDRYTSGDIQVEGVSTKEYDDVDWDTYRNKRIGFVFQSYNLIPHMNVLKNVALCLTLAGVKNEERKQRALEVLRKVGLESQAYKKPNQLSGGQMQRVAIARALVNNPEIILADEPTGALDSESGEQVLQLLKEVANDRLVIMVTHNGDLADKFSTRIVNLKDGEVVDDTRPYDSSVEEVIANMSSEEPELNMAFAEYGEADAAAAETVESAEKKNSASAKSCNKQSKWVLYRKKVRAHEKSSMSIQTAISLSWNNLLSKKGRTFLTSLAGSIGIIGIVLVLSLSTGVSKFIQVMEENALSQYPLEINQTNLDVTAVLGMLSSDTSDRKDYPSGNTVYTKQMLGKFIENFTSIAQENDLKSLKKHFVDNFDNSLGVVKYDYGTNFNVYAKDPLDNSRYMKVNPYGDVMGSVLEQFSSMIGAELKEQILSSLDSFGSMLSTWDEISDNDELLRQQYELVGGVWPDQKAANEVVVVLDKKNQLDDFALFMLGLKSENEVGQALAPGGDFANSTFTVDQLLNLRYKLLTDANYFYENEDNPGTYSRYDKSLKRDVDFIEDNAELTIKVVGVIRPKQGAVVTSINGVIGYTRTLTDFMVKAANDSDVAKAVVAAKEATTDEKYMSVVDMDYTVKNNDGTSVAKTVSSGDLIDEATHKIILREMGVADLDEPLKIRIYATSFGAKDKIEDFIKQYIKETGNNVKYTDYLALIMGYVGTLTNTVTYVLVGFAAISLLVSTIMIAIIVYTSVLERRKEIGVLRSLGARKKDISRVFLAESAILGGVSGLIGVLVSYILSFAGSAIIALVVDVTGLMQVTWWHCLMMIAISVLLSMLAGFVPSRIASKKDPAIALRTE